MTIDDVHDLLKTTGPNERTLMQQLLALDSGREGMVLAQLLHYFPGARLVEPERKGAPLTAVVQEMFSE
jgi:hypothetical protein